MHTIAFAIVVCVVFTVFDVFNVRLSVVFQPVRLERPQCHMLLKVQHPNIGRG